MMSQELELANLKKEMVQLFLLKPKALNVKCFISVFRHSYHF